MLTATTYWLTATVADAARLVGTTLARSNVPSRSIIIRWEVDGLFLMFMAVPTVPGVWNWLRGG